MKHTLLILMAVLTAARSFPAGWPNSTEVDIGYGRFYLSHESTDQWKEIIGKHPGYIPITAQDKFQLGLVYYRQKDYSNAFRVFHSAATNGHSDSEYVLSTMYKDGLGVEKDDVLSNTYLMTASSLRFSSAALTESAIKKLKEYKEEKPSEPTNPLYLRDLVIAGLLGNSNAIEVVRGQWDGLNESYFMMAGLVRHQQRDPTRPDYVSEERRKNLKGINRVRLEVMPVDAGAVSDGFNVKRIESLIEVRLRDVGIETAQRGEYSSPLLLVNVRLALPRFGGQESCECVS